MMTTLMQDLRYGVRMLMKSPGFTAVAIVALALAIGANTAMYSIINAMLLPPFPFRDLDRAVSVWDTVAKQNEHHMPVAPANFRDFKEQAKGFEVLSADRAWSVNLTGKDLAERSRVIKLPPTSSLCLAYPPNRAAPLPTTTSEPGAIMWWFSATDFDCGTWVLTTR